MWSRCENNLNKNGNQSAVYQIKVKLHNIAKVIHNTLSDKSVRPVMDDLVERPAHTKNIRLMQLQLEDKNGKNKDDV